MKKNEVRTVLNELLFTNICKHGFIKHQSTLSGAYDIRFTKADIKQLCNGDILEKEADDAILKFVLQDSSNIEFVREIVKRSPIYSDLAQDL